MNQNSRRCHSRHCINLYDQHLETVKVELKRCPQQSIRSSINDSWLLEASIFHLKMAAHVEPQDLNDSHHEMTLTISCWPYPKTQAKKEKKEINIPLRCQHWQMHQSVKILPVAECLQWVQHVLYISPRPLYWFTEKSKTQTVIQNKYKDIGNLEEWKSRPWHSMFYNETIQVPRALLPVWWHIQKCKSS